MRQEIEIEYKNLLTKNEFALLMDKFNLHPDDFVSQENYYFDTLDFSLKAQQTALRIRKKMDKFILTLKQPHEQGLLETHQELSTYEASLLLHNETIQLIDGAIKKAICSMGIHPADMKFLGVLKTERAEIKDGENILVLDHSYYLGHEDYELEYEVQDPVKGKERFLEIMKQNNILVKMTENKIMRFFKIKEQKEEKL